MLRMLFTLSTLQPDFTCETPGQISLNTSDAHSILPNHKITLLTDVVASKSRLMWVGDMPADYTFEQES